MSFKNEDGNDNSHTENTENDNIEVIKKRLADKDDFIETLKGETSELRTKMAEMSETVKILNELALKNKLLKDQPEDKSDKKEGSENNSNTENLTLEQIEKHLQNKTLEQKRNDNLNLVLKTMESHLGENYAEKLDALVLKEGISLDYAKNLAKESPNAFLKLFGVKADKIISPTKTSFNPATFEQKQNTVEKLSYKDLGNSKKLTENIQQRIQAKLDQLK